MSALIDKVRQRVATRSSALQRTFVWVTAVGLVFFGSMAGWAVADVHEYYRTARQTAPMTSSMLLAFGVVVVAIGRMARQTAYVLFGLAIMLQGVANAVPRILVEFERSRQLVLIFLAGSLVSCLTGLVVHFREKD